MKAQGVMCRTAVVLLSLLRRDEIPKNEHLRDVVLALTTWENWHSRQFGSIFSEEIAETSLSRFGSSLRSNPQVTTPEAAFDLWTLVRPGQAGVRHLRQEGPTAALCAMAHNNLQVFLRTGQMVVTHVPWMNGSTCVAEGRWPLSYRAPADVGCMPDSTYMKNLCLHYIHRMIKCPVPQEDSALHAALEDIVPRRPVVDRLRYVNKCKMNKPTRGWQGKPATRVPAESEAHSTFQTARDRPGFRGGRWHVSQEQNITTVL